MAKVTTEPNRSAADAHLEMITALRAKRPETKRMEIPSTESQEGNSFFVSVNGRRFLVPYDTPVDLPYEVAKVIEESRASDKAVTARRRKLAGQLNDTARKLLQI